MYKFLSGTSKIIRLLIGWKFIDNIGLTTDNITNQIIFEIIPIFSVIWFVSYRTTGILFGDSNPEFRTIMYFVFWNIYAFIIWLIVKFLYFINVLPLF